MGSKWPSSWRRSRLGDIADLNWGDTSVTKSSYVNTGFRAYSASGSDGFLPYADYDRTGVVVSAIGAECGRTWLARGKWSCIKNTLRFWATSSDVDTEFLYWLTLSHAIWPKRGSAQPFISQGDARAVEVAYPPLSEQRAIAHVLGTLDDKIELNRRTNETLEAMARALFKSWFIDFDPVRAKAEGRDPGLPTDIAALFPDSFQDSDLGEIPKGWKVEPFSDTVDIVGGGTPKTTVPEYWDGDIPWFSVVDAPSVTDGWVIDTEKKITHEGVEKSSTRILPVGTTIISARGTVGRLALVGVPMAMNQSCYGLQGKAEHSSSFTYYSTRRLVTVLQQHAHGSVFDTITRDTLAGVSILVPPANVVQVFDSRVSPIFKRLRAALFESGTLAALRDALLPKLMSGELRVATDQQL